ncbi:MAG: hypothetical protein CMJ85_03725 [Planctomycetes bacterium]|nr:hypothetical protein [Planctomycetota bacterium]
MKLASEKQHLASYAFAGFLLLFSAVLKAILCVEADVPVAASAKAIGSELVVGAACTVPALLLMGLRRLPARIAAGVLGAGWCWLAALSFGFLRRTGALPTWGSILHGIRHPEEAMPALEAAVAWTDLVPFALPLLVLFWPVVLRRAATLRALAGSAAIGMVGLGVAGLVRPGPITQPQLQVALVRPFVLPFGEAPSTTAFTIELPPADVLHAAWRHRPANAQRPNILVYMLEGVRASALSPYPPHLPTTPFLASLAKRSVVVDRCYCLIPCTAKSVISTHGGFPTELKVDYSEPGRMPAPGLPKLLGDIGYRSAFFFPGVDVHEAQELTSVELGFDRYFAAEHILAEWPECKAWLVRWTAKGAERASTLALNTAFGLEDRGLTGPLVSWMKQQATPSYVGVMAYSTHHPYHRPPDWKAQHFELTDSPKEEEAFRSYLDTVAYADDCLRELFAALEREGLLSETVVIITADHGQAFGEHGRIGHGTSIHDEQTHLPLIIHGPERLIGKPRRIGGLWQNLDVAQTIADVCGVPGARAYRGPGLGVSVLGPLVAKRRVYLSSWLHDGDLGVVRANGDSIDKTIWQHRFDRFTQFDLVRDPLERVDLGSDLAPAERRALADELLGFKWSIDEWYRDSDRREILAMRRDVLPEDGQSINAQWADTVRLVRVKAPESVVLNRHFRIELGFEVTGSVTSDPTLEIRLRQGTRVQRAPCVRDPNRFPVRDWKRGDKILLPLLIHAAPYLVRAGDLDIEVALRNIGNDHFVRAARLRLQPR